MTPPSCNTQEPMAPSPLQHCVPNPVASLQPANLAATLGQGNALLWLTPRPWPNRQHEWRLQRHMGKSEVAGGSGDTNATWHGLAESATTIDTMHGFYMEKQHSYEISFETIPFKE